MILRFSKFAIKMLVGDALYAPVDSVYKIVVTDSLFSSNVPTKVISVTRVMDAFCIVDDVSDSIGVRDIDGAGIRVNSSTG